MPRADEDEWRELGSWLVAGAIRVDVSEAPDVLVIEVRERAPVLQARLSLRTLAGLVERVGWRLENVAEAEGVVS